MTTVIPLGVAICQACRQPVAIVRRTVEVPCLSEEPCDVTCRVCHEPTHTHAIPDVAWTVVEADGERHLCPAAAA